MIGIFFKNIKRSTILDNNDDIIDIKIAKKNNRKENKLKSNHNSEKHKKL